MHDSALVAEQRIARMDACADAGFPFAWDKPYHIVMLTVREEDEEEPVLVHPILFCWN